RTAPPGAEPPPGCRPSPPATPRPAPRGARRTAANSRPTRRHRHRRRRRRGDRLRRPTMAHPLLTWEGVLLGVVVVDAVLQVDFPTHPVLGLLLVQGVAAQYIHTWLSWRASPLRHPVGEVAIPGTIDTHHCFCRPHLRSELHRHHPEPPWPSYSIAVNTRRRGRFGEPRPYLA